MPQNKQIEVSRILSKLKRLPEIIIKNKFSRSRTANLQEYTQYFAHQEVLEERQHNLRGIGKKRFTRTEQMLVKLLVWAVSSFVYSNTFRIYTANFGNLAWPAAIVGGFVASVGVDYLATEACSRYVHRQVTREALNKLERQKDLELKKGENNIFNRDYWNSKINLILSLEGEILASSNEVKILGWKISIDILFAAVLNVIEFMGAFFLVGKLGLFEDLPEYIHVIISTLPVVITWISAYIQAKWFHRSEYARELLRKYELKAEGMFKESIEDIHKVLVRLDAGIEAMLNSQSKYLTVELAELDAEIQYWEAQIEELKESAKVKLESLKNRYEQEKNEVEANYPEFDDDELQELTVTQVERLRQDYEAEKSQALADQFKEIDENKKRAIDEFVSKLQEGWQKLEIKRNVAIRKFEKKKTEFERDGGQNEGQVA
jgi:hypothetical protein